MVVTYLWILLKYSLFLEYFAELVSSMSERDASANAPLNRELGKIQIIQF